MPGARSDWSHVFFGTDSELTTTTTMRLTLSSGVLIPRIRTASNSSSASSTARMPRLSASPPSTRCRYGRSLPFANDSISSMRFSARAAGRAGLFGSEAAAIHAGNLNPQVPP